MTFFIFCSLVALAFIAAHMLIPKHPRIYCAFYGHEPKLGNVKVAQDLRWTCENCNREVRPL